MVECGRFEEQEATNCRGKKQPDPPLISNLTRTPVPVTQHKTCLYILKPQQAKQIKIATPNSTLKSIQYIVHMACQRLLLHSLDCSDINHFFAPENSFFFQHRMSPVTCS